MSFVPVSIAHHLVQLQVRIESIAETASKPGPAGLAFDDTLAQLTLVGRRRVIMLLERIMAFSTDEAERAAAEHIRGLAARVWYGGSVSFSSDDAEDNRERSTSSKRV